MSSFIVAPGGKAEISVAASDKIAIFSAGDCVLSQIVGYPNYPEKVSLIAELPAQTEYVSSAFSAAATVILDNSGNPFPALYEVGRDAVVKKDGRKNAPVQGDPVAVDVTGAISAAASRRR